MKEFIEILKKLFKNKKTRSLVILIIYFLFFLSIFLFVSSANKSFVTNDKFYYLNNIELIDYNVFDKDGNIIKNYNKDLIDNKLIYKLVKNSTLESTNYIENSNTYSISIIDFENIINGNTVSKEGNIKIIISSNKIILDFISHYGYKINIDIRS